jgi:hypothetical protein
MSTRELIQAELDTLSDEDLDALYALIKQFIQSKRLEKPRSLMATLRGIQIDAPPDFAAKIERSFWRRRRNNRTYTLRPATKSLLLVAAEI